MNRFLLMAALVAAPMAVTAQTPNPIVSQIVDSHILTRFQSLANLSADLAIAAGNDCSPRSQPLRAAYGASFDAWVSASHLRFGPTEVDDRAFALAFWPDSRGVTPKSLTALISNQDPVVASADAYSDVSIAARGFYAFEFLLYDDGFNELGDAGYRCTLIQTLTSDIASTSAAILTDWQETYAPKLLQPEPTGTYRSNDEVLQELFKALTAGLQFTSETRLGRPLGTFDRPRPKRAEAWRSKRSSRHVTLSLEALDDLVRKLAQGDPDLALRIKTNFGKSLTLLKNLDDPTFASVAAPQTHLRIEVIQQSIDTTRALISAELGPTLGVAAGFNALDGD
ncbi:imelysin family protein [Sulfitobacter sp.]|uniref:imelysin family protein n=1 Tax=Sulfitobacter sp. TaxID=1903071 RepID=UPI00300127A6